MIDHEKRRTLTIASATIVSTMLPTMVLGNNSKTNINKRARKLSPAADEDVSVIVSNLGKGSKVVTLRNNTGESLTVKHVYPGIVEHEGVTININEAIGKAGCTLPAGTCRILAVNPMNQLLASDIPTGIRRSKPSNITTLSSNKNQHGHPSKTQSNWQTVMFA
jgi:hypothetical protein